MGSHRKTIGIIGSMDIEIKHYLENAEIKRETDWNGIIFHESRLFDKDTVIVKSGVGKVFAAMVCERLIDEFAPRAVVFTGVAGALNHELDIGDVVLSKTCIQYDLDAEALGFPRGEIPYTHLREFKADETLLNIAGGTKLSGNKVITGTILTGDQFMTTKETEEHKYLTEELHGDAIEMEGGSIAQVCTLNKMPFIIVRTVADRADGTAAADFNKFLPVVARNSFNVVRSLLLNY
ncbi:MAG: 5'-methylthioadenosine/adenosylhomocysteine nucleosidase [Thermodesulfobacteriota bacterium]